MARIKNRVQSIPEDTRPPPPSNTHYLFRSVRTAIVWALVGVCALLGTWALLILLWLWVTR